MDLLKMGDFELNARISKMDFAECSKTLGEIAVNAMTEKQTVFEIMHSMAVLERLKAHAKGLCKTWFDVSAGKITPTPKYFEDAQNPENLNMLYAAYTITSQMNEPPQGTPSKG